MWSLRSSHEDMHRRMQGLDAAGSDSSSQINDGPRGRYREFELAARGRRSDHEFQISIRAPNTAPRKLKFWHN